MNNKTFDLPRMLNIYPEHTTKILQETERIKQLSNECGCSMGAKFMLASFFFMGMYFVFRGEFIFPKILMEIILGLLIVFVSSAVGKITGISLAKLRLARLYKSLHAKYPY